MFPFAENFYSFFTGACKYAAPDTYHTDYFSQTNAAATLRSDPANGAQAVAVRQPPFNIRILRGRNTTFTDGTIDVYATLKRPAGSTDACPEPVYKLTTKKWPASDWDTEPELVTPPATSGHWVSQAGTTDFDPGMPFGVYSICLRESGSGWTYGSVYDNTTQDGVQTTLQISGSSNSNSWKTNTCSYPF
jgi:hypothetical protein